VRFVVVFRRFGWWRVSGAVGVVFERFWRAEMYAKIACSGLKMIKRRLALFVFIGENAFFGIRWNGIRHPLERYSASAGTVFGIRWNGISQGASWIL
jgi:hypothetical protein